MKIIRYFLILVAICLILYPVVHILGHLFHTPVMNMGNYYFIVVLFVLAVVFFEDKLLKKSTTK
jgi:hypothetical protein